MSAAPLAHGRRLLSAALGKAAAFVIEPVQEAPSTADVLPRPVVAVVGLAPRCGATTVSRALAVELAAADAVGAAVVAGSAPAGGALPGGAAAGRLARAIGSPTGQPVRTLGRLCLVAGDDHARLAEAVRHLAPLVLDVGHAQPAGVAASLADRLLLVATAAVEPALAEVTAASLARVGPPPVVVLNQGGDASFEPERWEGRAEVVVERSSLGARLALAGRTAHGLLGSDLAGLADGCEAVGSAC